MLTEKLGEKFSTWKRRFCIGMAGLSGLALLADPAAAKEKQEENPSPNYNIELETRIRERANGDSWTSRFELNKGRQDLFRLERTSREESSTKKYGGTIPINSSIYDGEVNVFGMKSGEKEGEGLNFHGDLSDRVFIGGALEEGPSKQVINSYVGKKSDDSKFSIGLAEIETGDNSEIAPHGTAFKDLGYNNFIVGGGFVQREEGIYMHPVIGQSGTKEEGGVSWRFNNFIMPNGNYTLDLLGVLEQEGEKPGISKMSFFGPHGQEYFFHEGLGGLRAFDNINDYVNPPLPDHRRIKTAFARAKIHSKENSQDTVSINTAIYPDGIAEKFGSDISSNYLVEGFWLGAGCQVCLEEAGGTGREIDEDVAAKFGFNLNNLRARATIGEEDQNFFFGYYQDW